MSETCVGLICHYGAITGFGCPSPAGRGETCALKVLAPKIVAALPTSPPPLEDDQWTPSASVDATIQHNGDGWHVMIVGHTRLLTPRTAERLAYALLDKAGLIKQWKAEVRTPRFPTGRHDLAGHTESWRAGGLA